MMIKNALINAFLKTNQQLLESEVDITFSGSTCVCVYIENNNLYCSNIGDSRAITIKLFKDEKYAVNPVSID